MQNKIGNLTKNEKNIICSRYKCDCNSCPLSIEVRTGNDNVLLSTCGGITTKEYECIDLHYDETLINEELLIEDIKEEIEQVLNNSVFDIMSLQDFIEVLVSKYGRLK